MTIDNHMYSTTGLQGSQVGLDQCCCDSYSNIGRLGSYTSNPYTANATVGSGLYFDTLQDIISKFGNLRVNSMSSQIEIGSIPTYTLECTPGYLSVLNSNFATKNNTEIKEEKSEMENKFFNGMFGKLTNGVCRLSMDGEIAVKTTNGYKYYNTKSGRPVNCDQFVFDIGDEFFFVVPTNKTEVGDILLINGQPRYVLETKNNMITVLNYEDCTVESILPESHVFMGDTYFYGKIVSMFGDDVKTGGVGMKKMMRYMMLSEMMKSNSANGMNSLLPYFLMTGEGFNNLFDGLFSTENEGETNEVNA